MVKKPHWPNLSLHIDYGPKSKQNGTIKTLRVLKKKLGYPTRKVPQIIDTIHII